MWSRSTLVLCSAAVVLASACGGASQPASSSVASSAASPYQPVVSLNQIMVSIVDPHSHEIWDATGDPSKAPKTDEDWRNMRHAAVTLAAGGNLTMMSGNGPKDQVWRQQKDWNQLSQALSDAGLAAAAAVQDRNLNMLSRAGDQLVNSCLNCHREYKLEIPEIWADRELHAPK